MNKPLPTIVGDRLYGISMRPQELAIYGERVTFSLRYAAIFDDGGEAAKRHFKLLVLEIGADLPPDPEVGRTETTQLELLKCGWELELEAAEPVAVGSLPERDDEVPLLLGRIADTVNELARRAQLEAPLAPSVVDGLVADYRSARKAQRD